VKKRKRCLFSACSCLGLAVFLSVYPGEGVSVAAPPTVPPEANTAQKPSCDFEIEVKEADFCLIHGVVHDVALNLNPIAGVCEGFATISVSGLPAGATHEILPTPKVKFTNGMASATVKINTAGMVLEGGRATSPLTFSASQKDLIRKAKADMTVDLPVFDFSLEPRPSRLKVSKGETASTTVKVNLTGAACRDSKPVSLSLESTSMPLSIRHDFSSDSVIPPGEATLSFKASSDFDTGFFKATLVGCCAEEGAEGTKEKKTAEIVEIKAEKTGDTQKTTTDKAARLAEIKAEKAGDVDVRDPKEEKTARAGEAKKEKAEEIAEIKAEKTGDTQETKTDKTTRLAEVKAEKAGDVKDPEEEKTAGTGEAKKEKVEEKVETKGGEKAEGMAGTKGKKTAEITLRVDFPTPDDPPTDDIDNSFDALKPGEVKVDSLEKMMEAFGFSLEQRAESRKNIKDEAEKGYVEVGEEQVQGLELSKTLVRPMSDVRGILDFEPVSLKGTPFEALRLEGGYPEGGSVEETGTRWGVIARIFTMPNGSLVGLRENDFFTSGGGGSYIAREALNENVNGFPAVLSVIQSPSGKSLSEISWQTTTTGYHLTMEGNVRENGQHELLLDMARSISEKKSEAGDGGKTAEENSPAGAESDEKTAEEKSPAGEMADQ